MKSRCKALGHGADGCSACACVRLPEYAHGLTEERITVCAARVCCVTLGEHAQYTEEVKHGVFVCSGNPCTAGKVKQSLGAARKSRIAPSQVSPRQQAAEPRQRGAGGGVELHHGVYNSLANSTAPCMLTCLDSQGPSIILDLELKTYREAILYGSHSGARLVELCGVSVRRAGLRLEHYLVRLHHGWPRRFHL